MIKKIILNDPTIAEHYSIELTTDHLERYGLRSKFITELFTILNDRFLNTISPAAQKNSKVPYKGISFKVIDGSPFLLKEKDISKLQELQENTLNPKEDTLGSNELLSDAPARIKLSSNGLSLTEARILFAPE